MYIILLCVRKYGYPLLHAPIPYIQDVMDKTAAFVEQSDQVQQIFGRLSSLYPECSAEDLEAGKN